MILNIGSINVDHTYRVPHLAAPGETLAALAYDRHLGGKGANQSVALARAGAAVTHLGAVGQGDTWVMAQPEWDGVRTDHVARSELETGHAVIEVDPGGENRILIHAGANRALKRANIEAALDALPPGAWVLTQNEVNHLAFTITAAKARGLRVAHSPAPFVAADALPVLGEIDILAVNAGEAAALRKAGGDLTLVPMVLETCGKRGAKLIRAGAVTERPGRAVAAVDATGAGDCAMGYFLGTLDQGRAPEDALELAVAASALQVTRHGAAVAMPFIDQVVAFMEENT